MVSAWPRALNHVTTQADLPSEQSRHNRPCPNATVNPRIHRPASATSSSRLSDLATLHGRAQPRATPGSAKSEIWISEQAHIPVRPEPIGKTARTKLARYAVRHARAELRKAGTRPPTDHEALLAANLDRHRTPESEPRLCACGCGQPTHVVTAGGPRRHGNLHFRDRRPLRTTSTVPCHGYSHFGALYLSLR
jgi:hypothetical protein